MANKETKQTVIAQIAKTDYAKQMESLNKEVVSILGRQAELNANAYDLADRVANAYQIGVTDIFKTFLPNFDFTTAKYCYNVKQSEKFSWMYTEHVSALFSKIRLIGYLLSKNENFDTDLTAKIAVGKISLRIVDLPYQSFKLKVTGGKDEKDADQVLTRMVNTFKAVADKYLDGASADTVAILTDTVSDILNSVNEKLLALQEAKAKADAKAYKEFLKEFGMKDGDKAKELFKKYRK